MSLAQTLRGTLGPDRIRDRDGVLVALPGSVAEVQALLRLCRAEGASVIPEGGRTGLVGGTEAGRGQVVLSLARLAEIEVIEASDRIAVVQAGVTLEALQTAAAALGLEPGIDLAARGTATIGGMLSTNAGGVMAFRNGVMRHRVLGLEAVLPDGSLYSDMTRVVKNAAGYDLKHLLIGAEGTLGVITRAVVKLDPVPQATATALIGLPDVGAVLDLIARALAPETGHLRAAEALWNPYLRLTAAAQGWNEPAFPLDTPLALILQLGGRDAAALQEALMQLYADTLEQHPSATGLIATSARQERAVWLLRENTGAIYHLYPGAPSYDISVPLAALGRYFDRVEAELAELGLAPFLFGHLADGNLHLVLNHEGPLAPEVNARVEAILYAPLRDLGGSFSAEHGIGAKRTEALRDCSDPGKLALMAQIKRCLDPSNLMNPGKVLPAPREDLPQ